jgi:pimeloyl-ACP methyl ester carboxylesterase
MDTATAAVLVFNQPVANASSDLLFLHERDWDTKEEATVEAEVVVDAADASVVTLKPKRRLRYRATYTITAKAELQGANGATLGQEYTSAFSTLDLKGVSIDVANGRDVVVIDDYALILDRSDGLVTVDIKDPEKPEILQKTPVFTGPFAANQGFAYAPDFAYVHPTTGQPVYAPALVVVGWISMPQGGLRGLVRVFDATDPVHPKKLGSATIARCTTGVPTQVLVKDQYAIVASLLQGLVVVDLSKVIGESLKELALAAGEGTFNPGTTLQVAGPIGMSYEEDAANAVCEPGEPKAVVGTWNASGQLKWPMSLKTYGANALVSDPQAGVYNVDLGTLPSLEGSRIYAGPAFRLDVLPDIEVADPNGGEPRRTDAVAITTGNTLLLVEASTGTTVTTTTLKGAASSVLPDPDRHLLVVGTSQCAEAFDVAFANDVKNLGCSPTLGQFSGGIALTGARAVAANAAGNAKEVQIAQDPIKVTLYDARDFGPTYTRNSQGLEFALAPTDIPQGAPEMRGALADGVSMLVARATIPENSKAKKALFTIVVGTEDSWKSATWGGLLSGWPSAAAVRAAQGQQRIVVPIKESKRGTKTEKVAVAIYHPPTHFKLGEAAWGGFQRHVNLTVETIEDRPIDRGRSIQVRRRPVVLVHGYNSGPGTWGDLVTKPLPERLQGITLHPGVSYSDINTSGVDLIYARIPAALGKLRAELAKLQIAATRFDVLAHSTGGLATWTYVSELDNVVISRKLLPALSRPLVRGQQDHFRGSDNYGAGTINRIITVGTPYRGSELADRILAFMKCTDTIREVRDCAPVPRPNSLPEQLWESLLRQVVTDWMGTGDRSAYADLAASSVSDSGSALGRLWGSTPSGVPTHTIAGIAYDSVGCQERLLRLVRLEWTLPYGSSDLIVGLESARGGLSGDYTETMAGVCHTQETGPRLIIDRPGQRAPLPPLLNDLTSEGKFHSQGLPGH